MNTHTNTRRQSLAASTMLSAALAQPVPRAVQGAVQGRGDPAEILAQLQKDFADFKAENDLALKGKADVVTDEKLSRIDASVQELQDAIDEVNTTVAALRLNGKDEGVIGDMKADPDYLKAFKAHMRKGDQAGGEVQAAMTKGTAEDGGYLAPVEWDRTITGKLKQVSPIREHARVVRISTAGFKKLFNDRDIGSGWVGETAARPATGTPKLGQLDFPLGEIYANPAISQQMLDDAAIDLEAWLADEVDTEFARQEGIAFLSGDGTNKPHGLLTYVTGGANAARHPFGAIEVVNSGAAAAVSGDSFLDLFGALPEEFLGNAKLFTSRQSQTAMRKLKDGQGNYLWQPSFALGQPATVAGEAIVTIPGMPAIAANAIAALYGDMDETYLVVDRVGIRVLRDPFTNKPFVHFYTTKRVGGGVKNPEAMKALKVSA